ncbi:MAG: helix-turn-helix transcriptional regulator [Burkholderiaceae bacterium]|nr:helix-turn-helix transcriptional regulator [Burkholderiaceae bacterium]
MVLSIHHQRYESMRARMKAMRLEAGLTQAEMARRLKMVDQSYVSKIERGERYVDVMFFLDWCSACGVRASHIVSEFEAD